MKSTGKGVITAILIVQLIPLVLFPPDAFSPDSQEWWLPVLLAIMVIIAIVELLVRHGTSVWPWNLMAFAQGFNVIGRLMMLWPHATFNLAGENFLNWPYIVLTLVSIILSLFLLTYIERPDVRMRVVNA